MLCTGRGRPYYSGRGGRFVTSRFVTEEVPEQKLRGVLSMIMVYSGVDMVRYEHSTSGPFVHKSLHKKVFLSIVNQVTLYTKHYIRRTLTSRHSLPPVPWPDWPRAWRAFALGLGLGLGLALSSTLAPAAQVRKSFRLAKQLPK